MPTLMTVGNSEGQRRCDAKCYDAEGGACDCCCGGRNHGVGLQVATANTQELGERWLEAAAQHQGCTVAELKGASWRASWGSPWARAWAASWWACG